MDMRLAALLAAVLGGTGMAACTTIESVGANGEIISSEGAALTPDVSVSKETGAVAGGLLIFGHPVSALGLPGEVFSAKESALLYILYDPLAPNWTIKEQVLKPDTFHLSLRAKRFRVGGDGEAMQIVRRRAAQLQREKGYDTYRLLDYSEGIESSTPFTYRVSEGTIQLVKMR